jgi:uncharacterized protein GlcG (DUF336 family)
MALALASAVLMPSSARAQGATPMPLAKAVVSDDVAKTTLFKYQLSSTLARNIVNSCIQFGRTQSDGARGYAIFVLAPNGDIIDAHVGDGVVPIGAETGLMKAKTALYARTPSSVVASRFPTLEGRAIRMDLGKEQGLAYYFVGGGVPIVLEGQMIGSIGVGGGNMDEACAYHALREVLGIQPPPPAPAPARGGGAGAAGGGAGGRGGAPAK